MQIKPQLKALGFNESEINIYMYLLEHGLSFPKEIAEETGIARTNIYNTVNKLEDKKVVEEQEKDGKKAYLATSPKSIVRMAERKKEKAEQILSDLEALHNKKEGKPRIKFYDGLEQVKQLIEEHYETEELYAIGSTQQFYGLDKEYFKSRVRKLRENNVICKDIVPHSSRGGLGEDVIDVLGELYDVSFFPKKFGDISAVFLIWDNKTAIVHVEEPIFATVLINENIASALRRVIDSYREVASKKYVLSGGKTDLDKKMSSS